MPKTSRLLGLVFLITFCIGFFSVFAASRVIRLMGTSGEVLPDRTFSTGGNAGWISFDDTPTTYSGAELIGVGAGEELYLTGIFWIQTVGWATFGDAPVYMVPPPLGANVRDPWYLSGYAWSPNAGWIALNHGESYASGVWYLPDTRQFTGYGYSPTLGWIPFDGVEISTESGFIGKLGVQAGIGGDKTYNVLYDVGSAVTTTSLAQYINTIRKNVTILIRNAGGKLNTDLSGAGASTLNGAMVFRKYPNDSDEFLTYSDVSLTWNLDNARSLISIGADIFIDTDILPPPGMTRSRTVIALKNEKGQGGNIWIKGDVKKIEASLFAQGSLFSGEEFISGTLSHYYVTKTSLLKDIPTYQLYVRGTIGGSNTIGGSSKDGGAVCPLYNNLEGPCTYDSAIIYDLNYFRIYDRSTEGRAYTDTSKDTSSFIIEHDPRNVQDPPPGLEELQ